MGVLEGQGPVSAGCSGINYVLRMQDGTVEAHRRPFHQGRVVIKVSGIRSIELLRKSIMPPAAVGAASLIMGLLLRIVEEEIVKFVPSTLRMALEFFSFGVAVVCLVLLLARWFFANLVLRPLRMPPIVVRMVPTSAARRFFSLVQRQIPVSK